MFHYLNRLMVYFMDQQNDTAELLKDYICGITQEFPFIDPIEIIPCGHLFVKKSLNIALQKKPNSCPCCRGKVILKHAPSHITMGAFSHFLSKHPGSYSDVHFDLDDFRGIVQQNKLKDPIGERFLTVLAHAANHLNDAIEILASTRAGRDCLRQKLYFQSPSGKYFFGNAEISAESLETPINGRSIRDWLNMTTEREVKLAKIHKARQAGARARLFASRDARNAAAGHRLYSEDVNPLLQQLVYGEESNVREMLEAAKDNVAQLSALLEDTGTVEDYSGRTITGMTLLQSAAAAGDVEMCEMLKEYMTQEAFTCQLTELFPEGIEAHDAKLQQQVFNVDAVISAINRATPAELNAALNKKGAQLTQTDAARSKSENQLTLVEALNRFREQFSNLSRNEKIFNPYHLLRAYEAYNQFFDKYCLNGSDTDYKKCKLCWRQMVGYIQRFVPACYAQAFIQELRHLVKVAGYYQGSAWRLKALERNLKFKYAPGAYFSADAPSSPSVCLGLGFDFAVSGSGEPEHLVGLPTYLGNARGCTRVLPGVFLKTYVKQKQRTFRVLCAASEPNRVLVMNAVA